MKNNSNAKKEKFVMLASSVLVLTALTLTGIYMQAETQKQQDDGYKLDFTALEDDFTEEENLDRLEEVGKTGQDSLIIGGKMSEKVENPDDLDYMPLDPEADNVKLGSKIVTGDKAKPDNKPDMASDWQKSLAEKLNEGSLGNENLPEYEGADAFVEENITNPEPENLQASTGQVINEALPVQTKTIAFNAAEGILPPVQGEVLIPFSMDSSVYFTTLDQFKYNPGMIVGAQVGDIVAVAADGTVTAVYDDAELGHVVQMDLGNGYEITYGQLDNITVQTGDTIGCGELLGYVAEPTKYYALEGANLYVMMTKDGTPIDPEPLYRY